MWRSLFAVAIAYGCGHPILDGYRPPVLDRPLQAFYQEVNVAAKEVGRVLLAINDARITYSKAFIDRVEKQLHAKE